MSHIYDQRKRPQGPQSAPPEPAAAPGPSMDALMAGTARPTAEQKGRSIDLDAAMKAKMEHAFGDLSNLKLYESRAVGEAGAEAIAQGNEIAFAPGMANFSTRSGQERLGHELSHVMSQRSGAVRGAGFLANSALEAQADREGAMAAAGEQVYTGPVTHAISDASPSPSVAGPMQAKRRDEDAQAVKEMQEQGDTQNWSYALKGSEGYDDLNPEEWEEKTHRPGFSKLWGKKDQTFKVRKMTPAQKQASQDADNMYAIHRGAYNYYNEENPNEELTTENERTWLDQMTRNPSLELLWEMQRRYETLTKKAIAKRDKILADQTSAGGEPNIDMANFEAGMSTENFDAQQYLDILSAMKQNERNPALVQFANELEENGRDDRNKMVAEAKGIVNTNSNSLQLEGKVSDEERKKLMAREDEAGALHSRRSKEIFMKQRR